MYSRAKNKMLRLGLFSQRELRLRTVRNTRKYNPIPKRQFTATIRTWLLRGLGCETKEITWQKNGGKVVCFFFSWSQIEVRIWIHYWDWPLTYRRNNRESKKKSLLNFQKAARKIKRSLTLNLLCNCRLTLNEFHNQIEKPSTKCSPQI